MAPLCQEHSQLVREVTTTNATLKEFKEHTGESLARIETRLATMNGVKSAVADLKAEAAAEARVAARRTAFRMALWIGIVIAVVTVIGEPLGARLVERLWPRSESSQRKVMDAPGRDAKAQSREADARTSVILTPGS